MNRVELYYEIGVRGETEQNARNRELDSKSNQSLTFSILLLTVAILAVANLTESGKLSTCTVILGSLLMLAFLCVSCLWFLAVHPKKWQARVRPEEMKKQLSSSGENYSDYALMEWISDALSADHKKNEKILGDKARKVKYAMIALAGEVIILVVLISTLLL